MAHPSLRSLRGFSERGFGLGGFLNQKFIEKSVSALFVALLTTREFESMFDLPHPSL